MDRKILLEASSLRGVVLTLIDFLQDLPGMRSQESCEADLLLYLTIERSHRVGETTADHSLSVWPFDPMQMRPIYIRRDFPAVRFKLGACWRFSTSRSRYSMMYDATVSTAGGGWGYESNLSCDGITSGDCRCFNLYLATRSSEQNSAPHFQFGIVPVTTCQLSPRALLPWKWPWGEGDQKEAGGLINAVNIRPLGATNADSRSWLQSPTSRIPKSSWHLPYH